MKGFKSWFWVPGNLFFFAFSPLTLHISGCGAFHHDPVREARLWRQALEDRGMRRFFRRIVFAILPDRRSPLNVSAFQEAFSLPLK